MNYAEGLHFSAFHYNRKGFYSVVLQAVVSYNYLFTDLNIAWPSSVHDARVLFTQNVLIMICTGKKDCISMAILVIGKVWKGIRKGHIS